MFVNKNSIEKNENSVMIYKVKKEEWDSRKNKLNLYLRIPERSILFLE